MLDWAIKYYNSSNAKPTAVNVQIVEMDLSANQNITEAQSKKTKWLTTVDDSGRQPKLPADPSSTVISLSQQRIRVFGIVYSLKTTADEMKEQPAEEDARVSSQEFLQ